MVLKLLWAIQYSKSTFNQRTHGTWLRTVNLLYHGEMQQQNSIPQMNCSHVDCLAIINFSGELLVPHWWFIYQMPIFIYLYIFDKKSLMCSKPVKAVPVRILLLGIRTNSLLWFDKAPALQLFLHNSICLHERPSVSWMKVRSDTEMEVTPILVKAVSICLLLFTLSQKQSVFIHSSFLCVFWEKGAPWEQPDWGALIDGLPEAFFTKKKVQVFSSVWIPFRHLTRAVIFN